MEDAQRLIATLKLKPHPEGGYYRETYRSDQRVEYGSQDRSVGTAILYLLAGTDVSKFHRIDADEIWFYHAGGPLTLYSLLPNGEQRRDELSPSNPQILVKAGAWFGAALDSEKTYCLVSCTVMPGFEFSGFELATADQLLEGWPHARTWIERLT
jgi:hypothetical protein